MDNLVISKIGQYLEKRDVYQVVRIQFDDNFTPIKPETRIYQNYGELYAWFREYIEKIENPTLILLNGKQYRIQDKDGYIWPLWHEKFTEIIINDMDLDILCLNGQYDQLPYGKLYDIIIDLADGSIFTIEISKFKLSDSDKQ